HALSSMAGRQLPFVSVLIPFWLVATFVRIEGGSWKEAFEVWPATVVAGGVFAIVQFLVSNSVSLFLLTDVIAGIASVLAVVVFLRVWHPSSRFLLRTERAAAGPGAMSTGQSPTAAEYRYPYTLAETLHAW